MGQKRRQVRLTRRDDDVIVEAAGLLGVSPEEFMIHRALVDADLLVNGHADDLLDRPSHHGGETDP